MGLAVRQVARAVRAHLATFAGGADEPVHEGTPTAPTALRRGRRLPGTDVRSWEGVGSGEFGAEGAADGREDDTHVLGGLPDSFRTMWPMARVDKPVAGRHDMWSTGRIVVLVVRELSLVTVMKIGPGC